LREVREALELIRQDPRRFARVERHISRIHLGPWKPHGFFRPVGKICGISGRDLPFISYRYSSIIIHEATHGLLVRRGFLHTKHNRSRIEHLCLLEEARFLRRFPNVRPKLNLAYSDMSPNPFPLRGSPEANKSGTSQ
jgi:hypothetical protein